MHVKLFFSFLSYANCKYSFLKLTYKKATYPHLESFSIGFWMISGEEVMVLTKLLQPLPLKHGIFFKF